MKFNHTHTNKHRGHIRASRGEYIFILNDDANDLTYPIYLTSSFYLTVFLSHFFFCHNSSSFYLSLRWTITQNVVKGSACLASTHWLKYWIQFFYFAERNLTGIEQKCANYLDWRKAENKKSIWFLLKWCHSSTTISIDLLVSDDCVQFFFIHDRNSGTEVSIIETQVTQTLLHFHSLVNWVFSSVAFSRAFVL